MKKYIIKKGVTIGKPGLPGGKFGGFDKDTAIPEKIVAIIKPNLHHFIKAEKVEEVGVKKDADASEDTKKKPARK